DGLYERRVLDSAATSRLLYSLDRARERRGDNIAAVAAITMGAPTGAIGGAAASRAHAVGAQRGGAWSRASAGTDCGWLWVLPKLTRTLWITHGPPSLETRRAVCRERVRCIRRLRLTCRSPRLQIAPVAHQLALSIVERPIILLTVVPDWASRAREVLLLTWRKRPADRVLLVPTDTAHMPAGQIDGVGTHILERDNFRLIVDIDDLHRVIRRGVGVRIGPAGVKARRRQRLWSWRWCWWSCAAIITDFIPEQPEQDIIGRGILGVQLEARAL